MFEENNAMTATKGKRFVSSNYGGCRIFLVAFFFVIALFALVAILALQFIYST